MYVHGYIYIYASRGLPFPGCVENHSLVVRFSLLQDLQQRIDNLMDIDLDSASV